MTDKLQSLKERKTLGGIPLYTVEEIPFNFNLLLYGNPGVGKTKLAASAGLVEEMSPVLYINMESGEQTLHQMKGQGAKLDIADIRDWKSLRKLLRALEGGGGSEYKTIVLDNITEMQRICIKQVMSEASAKNPNTDMERPQIQDWGTRTTRVGDMLRSFRDMEANVIFCAHATTFEPPIKITNQATDTYNQLAEIIPYLSKSLAIDVSGMVDTLIYLNAEEKKKQVVRTMAASLTSRYFAKDRYDRLPSGQVPLLPMKDIWEILTGRKEYNA